METEKENKNWRRVFQAACAALFFLITSSVAVIEPKAAAADCNIDPGTLQIVYDAIATQPSIATNPDALAAYLGIIGQESSFNTQAIGKYLDKDSGRIINASYGLGQVNYYAHQSTINAMVKDSTGQDISGLPYNDAKAIAGRWLLDHPQAATNLSAQIFADNLARAGGDVARATYNYNGGSDKNYLAHVQNKIEQLQACGLISEGVVLSDISLPSDARASLTIDCPDLALAEALEVAKDYYATKVVEKTQASLDQSYENAAKTSPTQDKYTQTTLPAVAAGQTGPIYACTDYSPTDPTQCIAWASTGRQGILPNGRPQQDIVLHSKDYHGYIGDVGEKYCFSHYFETLENLISLITNPLDYVLNSVRNLLVGLTDGLCRYIVSYTNSLLSGICIPWPDLSFTSPTFGGTRRTTCDGVSLNDFLYLGQTSLTYNDVMYGTTGMRYQPWTTQDVLRGIARPPVRE